MKSTAEKVLDAAEDLFAEKGYDATSLGDVADKVGIRSPSLYNHFRNKQALYTAVVERLLQKFNTPLETMLDEVITRESVYSWLERIIVLHNENPNFARLVAHAALSGGPQTGELIERLVRPIFERPHALEEQHLFGLGNPALQPYAAIALNNIIMSYITMAPMYKDILGTDPYSLEAQSLQMELIRKLAGYVMGDPEQTGVASTS